MEIIIVEYRDEVEQDTVAYVASSQEKAEEYIMKNKDIWNENNNIKWWWATYRQTIDSEQIKDFRFYDKYGKRILSGQEAGI